jgi:3-methylfumaryl-CoA hydratase
VKKLHTSPIGSKTVVADPVMVFRYAAVAFSGHRIHYDYVYATEKENYLDVMVSGGLTQMLLFDLVRQHIKGHLKYFSSRNVRPLYVGERLHVCAKFEDDDRHLRLWVTDHSENMAVTANAELE